MANVGRVGRLAHLAVAHDVDAGGNLFSEHIVDHPRRFGFEARRIGRAAGFTRENELGQGFGPRQAASVGGEKSDFEVFMGGGPTMAGLVAAIPMRRDVGLSGDGRDKSAC